MPSAPARRALRRTDIVTAAAAQFAESGYPAVGMDQIGAAAGITGPAIYRHFDSKAAVLAAVFDGIIDAVTASPESRSPDAVSGTLGSGAPDAVSGTLGSGAPDAVSGTLGSGAPDAVSGTLGSGAPDAVSGTLGSGAPDAVSGTLGSGAPDGSGEGPPEFELTELVQVYAAAVAARRRLMAVFVREVHHLPPEHRSGLEARQRALIRRWRTLLAKVHPNWDDERVRTAVHGCFGMLNAVGTFDSPLPDTRLTEELTQLARRALGLGVGA